MGIRGVVFDIGGVLEMNPRTGWAQKWEQQLGLSPGEFGQRLESVWRGGSIGSICEEEVHLHIENLLGMSPATVQALMDDLWIEYLGRPNLELMEYFRSLRPPYQTAILSNSFVGAREREQALYGFENMCDFIVYSHEVGLSKPDPGIYALTCKWLNLKPAEVVFLDDLPTNIAAARAFGLEGILFQDNAQAIAALEACLGVG